MLPDDLPLPLAQQADEEPQVSRDKAEGTRENQRIQIGSGFRVPGFQVRFRGSRVRFWVHGFRVRCSRRNINPRRQSNPAKGAFT